MARAGQIEPARLVLDQISGNATTQPVIIQIAQAQALTGLVPEAIETAYETGPDIAPEIELLLSLWHITPDPRFVAALRDILDRTDANHRHRRFALFAMSIVDPKPEYAAEIEEILSNTDRESGQAFEYPHDAISLLCAAGRYSDALALVLAERPENVGRRVLSLNRIALCLSEDPLRT